MAFSLRGLGDLYLQVIMSSSNKVPAAMANQQRMLQARFPPARGRDDDTRSESSWSAVTAAGSESEAQGGYTSGAQQGQPMDPIGEEAAQFVPPPPTVNQGGQPVPPSSAPVNQAARNLVDHTNEPPAARRLRRQQEQAQRRGRRGIRYGQMGAHNACNAQLPGHIRQVGSKEGERSVLVLDSRDHRLQSPFQGWLLDEILTNANARINVVSDASQVRSPTTGYHCNLFMIKALDNYKLVVAATMTSYGSVPCGKWDHHTAGVMSHVAFQPFRWPVMTDESPTWVDVKVKMEGDLLIHLELRGYRSDHDMSVQICHVADSLLWSLEEKPFIPTFVVTVFQGWRVISTSWEVGGRLYALSEGGVVVALDYPLCHVELRLVTSSSPDAFGLDADRLEFRFYSGSDRLNVACSTCSVPPTWLVVSRVSGPTLIKNAAWCRDHYARIESPDQTLHLSQLASVHAHWTVSVEAAEEEETGPRISAVAVESNPKNMHLISEAPLFRKEKVIVAREALAVQAHDAKDEVKSAVLPPIAGGPAVQPVGVINTQVRALTGATRSHEAPLVPVVEEPVSLTEPGVAPTPADIQVGSLAPSRRSLEQRRSEALDQSAMTPATFVDRVGGMWSASSAAAPSTATEPELLESVTIGGVRIELTGGSLGGSAEGGAQQGVPRSFQPPNFSG